MMRYICLSALLCILVWPLCVLAAIPEKGMAMEFYVSPQGNDDWSGHLDVPHGQDGPFATVARAVRAAREAKAEKVTIHVRGGTYSLAEPITITPEDGAVFLVAYPGETPVFTGSQRLTGWTKVTNLPAGMPAAAAGKVWAVTLPGHLFVSALYLGETRLPAAMTAPSDDWERWPAAAPGAARDTLLLPKELTCAWAHPAAMRMNFLPTLYTYWKNVVTPVLGIEGNMLRFDERALPTILTVPKRVPLRLENVPECLASGTWVQLGDTLYLWPPDDTDMATADISHPALTSAIIARGDDGAGRWARNFILRGLRFARFGDGLVVLLDGVEDCAIERCEITQGEGTAIAIRNHAVRVRVQGNTVSDMGRSAVAISGRGFGTTLDNRDHLVCDNTIHHCGRVDWHATGIGVGGGAGYVTISHNHIHHMPYSCVQTGASKIREYKFVRANPDSPRARGYRLDEIGDTPLTVEAVKRFTAGHVVMEYNYCHDFMLRLDDGGALYAHATHHTVMRGNLLARAGRPNAFGLYYDDEELDSVMEGNIVARCPSPGKGGGSALHLHDNARITVRHNIFAFSHRLCSVPNSYGGIRLTENIFLFSGGCLPGPEPKTVRGPGDGRRQPDWDAGPSTMDRNLYWSADQPDAARAFLAAWQAKGWDAHSAVADPRFADAANLDFTLPADSPALKLGFQALELTDVGPRKEWRE